MQEKDIQQDTVELDENYFGNKPAYIISEE